MTDVRPKSLDGSANTLLELAGLLQAGRPELTLSGRVTSPTAHEEVANKTRDFAGFAHDQYEDVVALLTALSTKLQVAAGNYTAVDAGAQQKLDSFLTNSTYRPA
ncbi:type VII secretion target [Plantactinospora solaniradicis]|uniref:Type VII secretion target n=1 Tax=Plantactinospora solaniradicis TaxID=1723736 RepID=A0ABW1K3A6_9ACTN